MHHHRLLHAALRQAVRWQLLARSPAEGVEPPRAEPPDLPTLLINEVPPLRHAADSTAYGPLVRFALLTGMRKGEICGVRWRDIDLEAGVAHVRQVCQWLTREGFAFRPPKTPKSRRVVSLSPESIQLLRRVRATQAEERLKVGPGYQDYGPVFATQLGLPIEPSALRRAWLSIVRATELDGLHFHDLRHACATFMLQQGTNVKVVSERLGHSGVRITLDTYASVLPGIQAEAAARLDMIVGGAGAR